MRLDSLLLVLISAFAHALLSLLIKKSKDKQIFCWLYNLTELVIFAPIPIYYLYYDRGAFPSLTLLLLAVGFLHYIYVYTFAKAFEEGDLSLVYPIIRSSPALVLAGDIIFLGEQISALGATGVLLTVVGVYALCMRSSGVPVSSGWRTSSTQFAFLTALIATAFTLLDKVYVLAVPPALYLYIIYTMTTAGLTAQNLCTTNWTAIRAEAQQFAVPILACAVLEVVGYLLVLIAFQHDKASYVVGLRQISIIIAVAMGGVILREQNLRRRSIASLVILGGILLICFAK